MWVALWSDFFCSFIPVHMLSHVAHAVSMTSFALCSCYRLTDYTNDTYLSFILSPLRGSAVMFHVLGRKQCNLKL